jgi:hypothetical protein
MHLSQQDLVITRRNQEKHNEARRSHYATGPRDLLKIRDRIEAAQERLRQKREGLLIGDEEE